MKLTDITPVEYQACPSGCGCGCPAVFETDNGTYVIIGKKADAAKLGISTRVADDEFVIEVQKGMIDGLK